MKLKLINYHLKRADKKTIGFILFKPNIPSDEIVIFRAYCKQLKIKIIREKRLILDKNMILALYPSVFNLSKNDLIFGVVWKKETIQYLTSDYVHCFLVEGNKIYKTLKEYKYFLRTKYGKITNPKNRLTTEEFLNKVVKNIAHSTDEKEIQNILWLIYS